VWTGGRKDRSKRRDSSDGETVLKSGCTAGGPEKNDSQKVTLSPRLYELVEERGQSGKGGGVGSNDIMSRTSQRA